VLDLTLLTQQRLTVDGQPALQTDFSWRIPDAPMHQRQVLVLVPKRGSGPQQMMIFTASAQEKLPERWLASFQETLKNLHFKR
ncbi:MAG: DcrB-related protein, partial [Polyangiaceae bacterium]